MSWPRPTSLLTLMPCLTTIARMRFDIAAGKVCRINMPKM